MSDQYSSKITTPMPSRRRAGPSVADAIALRVVGGEWPEGAVFPTEIELAEELGLARSAARKNESGVDVFISEIRLAVHRSRAAEARVGENHVRHG
jgi:hypothetical protein